MRQLQVTAPEWREPATGGERIDLRVNVVTPLFGGGFEAREVDLECVIRPAAIRGQLRFWWRATVGVQYSSPDALFEAESALWGSASQVGQVAVVVVVTKPGQARQCARYERRPDGTLKSLPAFERGWPAYALQAFQGEVDKRDRARVAVEPSAARIGAKFDLTVEVRTSAKTEEVRGTIAAWIRYGGLGARTRRGCGSLASDWMPEPYLRAPLGKAAQDLTHLRGALAVWGDLIDDPCAAWSKAVSVYRDFRQREGLARNHGAEHNRPGRSRWPEPDSIRRLSDTHAPGHPPAHVVGRGFPRADLGLPIIFHFKDRGDPEDATLHGPEEGLDRFASPVITKAVAENGRYRPLVLVLAAPPVSRHGDLRLDIGSRKISIGKRYVELSSAERASVGPLEGQATREALIRFVEREWKTTSEVLQ